ncbi:hypothetical protein IKG60_01915 [Candidatus Saccharibacteria bacterium]|nr:hypothetical protein [Candidatus Saccharibacteria bacterium]
MTKKYMDFAPVRKTTAGKAGVSVGSRTNTRTTTHAKSPTIGQRRPSGAVNVTPHVVRRQTASKTVQRQAVQRQTAQRQAVSPQARGAASSGLSIQKNTVKLGEIEDFNQKFVVTNVPKRPLGSGAQEVKASATEAKAKKVGGRIKRAKGTKVAKVAASDTSTKESKASYAVPKTPFINQGKVAKRPLSKNVYRERASTTARTTPSQNKSSGEPLTIVSKPKKDSKVGIIVAIILTIILGAVAGTVAFLLLPK